MTAEVIGMRILIVASEFPPGPGGIGTHAHQLATELHRLGHEIRVVANFDHAPPERIAEFIARQPFTVHPLARIPGAPLKLGYRYALLRTAIARWRPDVVLASGDREIYAAALARRGVPWICVEHGRRPLASWEKSVKRWAFGRADRVIAVSDYSRAQLLELGARPRAIGVIHNGADALRFGPRPPGDKAAVLVELGLASAHFILSIGNVSERKGQDIMISAMPDNILRLLILMVKSFNPSLLSASS